MTDRKYSNTLGCCVVETTGNSSELLVLCGIFYCYMIKRNDVAKYTTRPCVESAFTLIRKHLNLEIPKYRITEISEPSIR